MVILSYHYKYAFCSKFLILHKLLIWVIRLSVLIGRSEHLPNGALVLNVQIENDEFLPIFNIAYHMTEDLRNIFLYMASIIGGIDLISLSEIVHCFNA